MIVMKNYALKNKIILAIISILFASPVWAVSTEAPDKNWYMDDVTFWILIAVAAILFYVIYALTEVVIWSGKKKVDDKNKPSANLILLLIGAGLLVVPNDVLAQATSLAPVETAKESIWTSVYLPLYILIAIEICTIAYLTLMLVQLSRKEKLQAAPGVKYETWLARTWSKWNYKVPIEREDEMILSDHEYDGIQELDNGMPPWLQYIFIGTIIFAIVYLWKYDIGNGLRQEEEYVIEVEKAKIELAAYLESASANYDENSVILSTDPSVLSNGKNTFTQYCVTCHGNFGEGNVGPNFTDDYWIHGGKINDLFRTVSEGVPSKGMASWKEILTAKQMFEVSNYIKSLHGTNPPNPKAPQGNLYTEGAEVKGDSGVIILDSLSVDTMEVAGK